jgi:hypothetical protein
MGHTPAAMPTTDDLSSWRLRLLTRAGFEQAQARALAGAAEVDLHALLDLVDRGCPPHLAARILAPLDAEPRKKP